MTPPQQELRVLEILGDALKLSGDALEQFLEKSCGGDAELRAELDELLAESELETEDFLATTPFGEPLDRGPDIRNELPIEPAAQVPPAKPPSRDLPTREPPNREPPNRAKLEPHANLEDTPSRHEGPFVGRGRKRMVAASAGIALALALLLASRASVRERQAESPTPMTQEIPLAESRDPDLAASLHERSQALFQDADFEAAEPLARQALELRLEALGEEAEEVADTSVTLGRLLHASDRLEEAEAAFDRALSIYRRRLGTEHLKVGETLELYGSLLVDRHQPQRAQFVLREAHEMMLRLLGDGHPRVAEVKRSLDRAQGAGGETQNDSRP